MASLDDATLMLTMNGVGDLTRSCEPQSDMDSDGGLRKALYHLVIMPTRRGAMTVTFEETDDENATAYARAWARRGRMPYGATASLVYPDRVVFLDPA